MNKCTAKGCRSHAINLDRYERDDQDQDLCDVHYWMKRAQDKERWERRALGLETVLREARRKLHGHADTLIETDRLLKDSIYSWKY